MRKNNKSTFCYFTTIVALLTLIAFFNPVNTYATDLSTIELPSTKAEAITTIEENITPTTNLKYITPTQDNSLSDNTIVSSYMEERDDEIKSLKELYPNYGFIDYTGEDVYIYEEKDINSLKVGVSKGKSICYIEEFDDNWSKIISNDIEGYVESKNVKISDEVYIALYSDELDATNKTIVVNTKRIKVYEQMDDKSKVVKTIKENETWQVENEQNDWVSIYLDDNSIGYIKDENITIYDGSIVIPDYTTSSFCYVEKIYNIRKSWITKDSKIITLSKEEVVEERKEIVDFALSHEGNPYVWGGTDLSDGADCSGFVQSTYEHFGFELPRTAAEQSQIGIPVNKEDLQVGDLVFYPRNGYSVGHVGIYIGNGQIINALNENKGIIICDMDYNTPVYFSRIIGS